MSARRTDTHRFFSVSMENRQAFSLHLPSASSYRRGRPPRRRGEILGFLGLEGDYIAGIFVRHGAQSRGVGKKLLDRAKEGRGRLSLRVYEKNTRAAAFYRRGGFSAPTRSKAELVKICTFSGQSRAAHTDRGKDLLGLSRLPRGKGL